MVSVIANDSRNKFSVMRSHGLSSHPFPLPAPPFLSKKKKKDKEIFFEMTLHTAVCTVKLFLKNESASRRGTDQLLPLRDLPAAKLEALSVFLLFFLSLFLYYRLTHWGSYPALLSVLTQARFISNLGVGVQKKKKRTK